MTTPGPNWYDVLDVDPTATTDEIRDAWRAAIADLTPTDRRFRLYNQAAEVLLAPERRAAHDAELARQDEDAAGAPEAVAHPAAARRSRREALAVAPAALRRVLRKGRQPRRPAGEAGPSGDAGRRGGRHVPTSLLVVLAILATLGVGATAYLWSQPSAEAIDEAASGARNAAERAVVAVLSYDHETLDEDREAAHEVITSDYRKEKYDPLFAVIEENAPRTETTVGVDVVASSIARVDDEGERVQVLLFLDRPTTNRVTEEPVVYKDQTTVTMQRVGEQWLVDGLETSPAQQ